MERAEGSIDMAGLKITNSVSINRVWTELNQLRGALGEQNILKRAKGKLRIHAGKRANVKAIINDEEVGIKHGVHAVELLYSLMRNFTYDVHVMIDIFMEMLKENDDLKKRGMDPKIEKELELHLRQALRKIKGYLRRDSDMIGALSNSIKV